MAAPDRKLLWKAEGTPSHRHALLQDRRKLQRLHLHRGDNHQAEMNVNTP